MWDRIDDAFDDERYGTHGELQADIERLETELRARGIPVPSWTPPWEGRPFYSREAQRAALYGRKVQLEDALHKNP